MGFEIILLEDRKAYKKCVIPWMNHLALRTVIMTVTVPAGTKIWCNGPGTNLNGCSIASYFKTNRMIVTDLENESIVESFDYPFMEFTLGYVENVNNLKIETHGIKLFWSFEAAVFHFI